METDPQSKTKQYAARWKQASQILKILPEFPVGFLYPPNLHFYFSSPEYFGGSSCVYLPDHQVWVTETKWPQHITRKAILQPISSKNKLGQFPWYSIIFQQYQASSLRSNLFFFSLRFILHSIKFTFFNVHNSVVLSIFTGCTNITTT